MKTVTLLFVLSTFSATAAYSQAAGGYAGAAAASQTTAAASANALGHAQQTAVSQTGSATANAAGDAAGKSATASGAASEATSATEQMDSTMLSAAKAESFSAELTHSLNSKNAKVGDEVIARTTSKAQLAGGEKLPKGTKLIGKVTEVRPKSSAEHDGHLAFAFDRAVLRDGREIPIHAALDSISAPANVAAMAGGSDEFAAGAAPVPVSGGGRAGGGLLGGGAVAVPSVPRTGLISGATSTAASAPAHVVNTTGAAAHQTGAALHQTAGVVSQTAGTTFGAVSYLPGVTASSSASNSTILEANGSNVDLSSGTELMLTAAAR